MTIYTTDSTTTLLLMMAIFVIATICSMLSQRQFSSRIFLSVIAIGIAILCWLPVIPSYMFVASALCMVAMIFTGEAEHE